MSETPTVILNFWYLECQADGSRKMYSIYLNESSVTLHWGKIGTVGQTKQFDFASEAEASDFARSKFYAKKSKGYEALFENVLIETSPLFRRSEISSQDMTRAGMQAVRTGIYKRHEMAVQAIETFTKDVSNFVVSFDDFSDEVRMKEWYSIKETWDRTNDQMEDARNIMEMALAKTKSML